MLYIETKEWPSKHGKEMSSLLTVHYEGVTAVKDTTMVVFPGLSSYGQVLQVQDCLTN